MQEHPWVACEGSLFFGFFFFFFGMSAAFGLDAYCFFPVCVGHYPPDGGVKVYSLSMLPGSLGQWVAPGHQILGRDRYPWGSGGIRLLLLAGPWAVAMTLREVEVAPRAFVNGNRLVAGPSTPATSEMPGAAGSAWPWDP